MKNVLVLGGKGQLAQCIQKVGVDYPALNLIFLSSKEADIGNHQQMKSVFERYAPSQVINCAAYTAVDLAEDEQEQARRINTLGPEILAKLCKAQACALIHVSTDFVFEGDAAFPLTELDPVGPLSVYGKTKLEGEQAIMKNMDDYLILRTSWLYAEFGNNFLKTMLRLGTERERLGVVSDQIGTPTYAIDLAKVILLLASNEHAQAGIYHYSNEGVASWYDFAHAIFKLAHIQVKLGPIPTAQFPTKAIRPAFSVMDKRKIKETFHITIPHWQDSLEACIDAINQNKQ